MRQLIRCERFAAGFNSHTVLSDVSFSVPEKGITCFMGPGGVGKTTMVRTLARLNDAFPSYWWRGKIEFDGRDYLRDIDIEESSTLVRILVQKAKLYTATVTENIVDDRQEDKTRSRSEKCDLAQAILSKYGLLEEFAELMNVPVISLTIGQQRALALVRLASKEPRCLLLDEPLRDMNADDEHRIVLLLRQIAAERAVVMVTHNQRYAREIGDQIHLFTAGKVVASGPCPQFFDEPPNELAKTFVTFGNVWPTEETEADTSELEKTSEKPDTKVLPPLGMHWVLPDKLASMQKPGLLRDLDEDLAGLKGLGVRTLVTLMQEPIDPKKMAEFGLESVHFPIIDMSVPDIDLVTPLCQRLSDGIDADEVFVVHCKAGLGRTGLILACVLVYRGATAVEAIDVIRLKNAKYIQTEEQAAFVSRFEVYLREREADNGRQPASGTAGLLADEQALTERARQA